MCKCMCMKPSLLISQSGGQNRRRINQQKVSFPFASSHRLCLHSHTYAYTARHGNRVVWPAPTPSLPCHYLWTGTTMAARCRTSAGMRLESLPGSPSGLSRQLDLSLAHEDHLGLMQGEPHKQFQIALKIIHPFIFLRNCVRWSQSHLTLSERSWVHPGLVTKLRLPFDLFTLKFDDFLQIMTPPCDSIIQSANQSSLVAGCDSVT